MEARGAAWAAAWSLVSVLAVAAAAPADSPAAVATASCDPLLLKGPPPKPPNVVEYEAAAIHAARAFSELVRQNEANDETAANMARTVARTPLDPPPAAVAVGCPRLHIGVLFIAEPPRLVIFQQNNSASLQQFWRTLASAWNASTVVWSNAWFSCEEGFGWWGGAAAAYGSWTVRAAAALFRRIDAVPCEETMHSWLGNPPRCHQLSTECNAVATSPTQEQRLEYRCKCRPGYWQAGGNGWIEGTDLVLADTTLACAPCEPGGDAAACLADVYRAALLAANLAGMLLCVVIGLIIFKKRKSKAVAMGMWTVLEVVLVGALLMYGSAASQYLSSSKWRCIAGAWLRELGFVACYGSVVLRLWVLLAEFRTRKAHRWTPRDSEVLRVVGAMVSGAACYLAAFTATAACEEGAEGCARAAWHHVTAGAEMLLLFAGLRIAWAARNANVPFQERGWLASALCCEVFCGIAWRMAAIAGAAPERSPLAATARAHLSSGAALACVLAPRLWHGYRARSLAQEVSRRGPAEGFGGIEGEEEPTSEEVRAELKRLYVQLEILRNKTLRRDNPHISKRRGGRKPPHRRFSLQGTSPVGRSCTEHSQAVHELTNQISALRQSLVNTCTAGLRSVQLRLNREAPLVALQARRGGKGKSGGSASAVEASEAGDASRTPEDSVCSNEGPSHYTDGDTQA